MAPERLQGQSYSIQSDIWSPGMSTIMALSVFPISPLSEGKIEEAIQKPTAGSGRLLTDIAAPSLTMSVFESLLCIIGSHPPTLPTGFFGLNIIDFVNQCLRKDPKNRPHLQQLLDHVFMRRFNSLLDFPAWVTATVQTRHQQHMLTAQQTDAFIQNAMPGAPSTYVDNAMSESNIVIKVDQPQPMKM